MLKSSALITVIIISCLLVCSLTQRGGSRSKPSPYSSSPHPTLRGHQSHNVHNTQTYSNSNCTTINGTTTCVSSNNSEGGWGMLIIILGVFGVIGYISVKAGQKQAQKRRQIVASVMNDFEARSQQWPSVCNLQVRQAMIDAFMNRHYTMVINVKDQKEMFYCQLKVTDLKKINDGKYEVKMSGTDEVGTSKIEGLLVFRGDGFAFKLSKVYDDRQKAEQTGKFDILLYEGFGNPDRVGGQWAFHGYETSTEYAGFWYMAAL